MVGEHQRIIACDHFQRSIDFDWWVQADDLFNWVFGTEYKCQHTENANNNILPDDPIACTETAIPICDQFDGKLFSIRNKNRLKIWMMVRQRWQRYLPEWADPKLRNRKHRSRRWMAKWLEQQRQVERQRWPSQFSWHSWRVLDVGWNCLWSHPIQSPSKRRIAVQMCSKRPAQCTLSQSEPYCYGNKMIRTFCESTNAEWRRTYISSVGKFNVILSSVASP